MRVVISGASGFIGAAVARRALTQGCAVAVVARAGSNLVRLGSHAAAVTDIRSDLDRPDTYAEALAAFAPNVAIHCAWDGISGASRDDVSAQAANFTLSMGFFDACRRSGATSWVGLGSQAEYGKADRKLDETAPPLPSTIYGAVKLAVGETARLACAKAGLRFAWMRVFNTYGPDDNPNFLVPSLITRLLAGERPSLSAGTQIWDLVHVDDAAAAIMHVALQGGLDGIFNLGGGDPRTIRRIAEDVRDAVNPALALGLGDLPMAAAAPTHLEADIGRLERSGWRPSISWADGLRQTVAWHRDQRKNP